MNAFENYHPIVILTFFVAIIGTSMFFIHPVFLGITISMAICLNLALRREQFLKDWKLYIPLFFLTSIINPLISHNGEHVLVRVYGKAITLEAILYGVAMAVMIIAVMLWFSCYNEVMTSDKFLAVFGKLVPTFALTVIITLRLVPRFQQQLQKIAVAQKAIGLDYTTGSLRYRLLCIVRMLSILMTWALENAVETADMMKARGYGLPGKSTFSNYSFRKRDGLFLFTFSILFLINLVGFIRGTAQFSFYPTLSTLTFNGQEITSVVSFFLLCSLPIVVELRERMKWRY